MSVHKGDRYKRDKTNNKVVFALALIYLVDQHNLY